MTNVITEHKEAFSFSEGARERYRTFILQGVPPEVAIANIKRLPPLYWDRKQSQGLSEVDKELTNLFFNQVMRA